MKTASEYVIIHLSLKTNRRRCGLNTVLEVKDLAITFGSNQVLSSLSFEVNSNEVLGVIGPNGAGKTVLLNILTGILKPSGGKVLFLGADILGKSITERTRIGIGRTFQIPRPFQKMTVFENIIIGGVYGDGLSEKAAAASAFDLTEMIGLSDKIETLAGKLGLLDRKRLEIGVALASRPKLLLIDEVAGGLTESEVVTILDIVRTVKEQGVSVIWIEHVIETMMRGTDRVMCLADGRNVICGAPEEVMRSGEVHDVYLGVDEE